MLRPYIAISTRAGLQSLRPECEVTAQCCARRAYQKRRTKPAYCWWASISDATAAEVIRHIAQGDRIAALEVIDRTAAFLGPIFGARRDH